MIHLHQVTVRDHKIQRHSNFDLLHLKNDRGENFLTVNVSLCDIKGRFSGLLWKRAINIMESACQMISMFIEVLNT